jgi:hypothetical protein
VLRFVPAPCATDADCAGEKFCDRAPTAENDEKPSGLCVEREGEFAGLPCGAAGERADEDKLLHPGRCEPVDPTKPPRGDSLIASAVEIGAFATDVVYRRKPGASESDPGRIFFPVRGDATLHWADIDRDGRIVCGQRNNQGACDDDHRVGDDPDLENSRDLRMPAEPFAIDASSDGEVVVVSHQTADSVSLLTNRWSNANGPELEFTLERLASYPVGVAALPTPAAITQRSGEQPNYGFLISYRNAPQINLVRYVPDAQSEPERPYLAPAAATPILVNSLGRDSRGIAVDDSVRRAAELDCFARAGCAPGSHCKGDLDPAKAEFIACLDRAAAYGLDVYVANRSPDSLLVGRTLPATDSLFTTEVPAFYESIPMPAGASRVVVGRVPVGGSAENPIYEVRVFVVCFDSRRIAIYDPKRNRVELEIPTGRGPHAIAIDSERGLLYVGHFTDSYIGVVSIDRRFSHTYGTMLATIGKPTPPRASK